MEKNKTTENLRYLSNKEQHDNMKLRLKFGLLLIILTFNLPGNSQKRPNNFALTLDLAGNSGFYSLNGEYEIGQIKNCKLNARVGFGYYPLNDGDFVSIPIGFNLVTGTKKHHIELGLGTSYIKGLEDSHVPAGLFGNTQELRQRSEAIYLVPTVGYRYDNLIGGLILKIYYSPLITIYDFFDREKYLYGSTPYNETSYSGGYHTGGNTFQTEIDPNYSLPTAINRFGYFGVSIGYRF